MITKIELLNKLEGYSNKVYYSGDYSQLTIDLIEEYIPTFINDSINDWETTIGALSYRISTLLEVMDESMPDYTLFKEFYELIKNN